MQFRLMLVLEPLRYTLYTGAVSPRVQRLLPLGASSCTPEAAHAVGKARKMVFTMAALEDQRLADASATGAARRGSSAERRGHQSESECATRPKSFFERLFMISV